MVAKREQSGCKKQTMEFNDKRVHSQECYTYTYIQYQISQTYEANFDKIEP